MSGDAAVWKDPELTRTYLAGVRGAIPLAEDQIRAMLRVVDACAPIDRFLDLGCGDGILGAALQRNHPAAIGVFADFSAPMLDAARARPDAGAGARHFVEIDYGDPAWTKFVDRWAPFDAVVSGYSIHHQPDARKREVCGEIHELLRPGGIFVNVEHVRSATPWVEARHDANFIDALVDFERRNGGQRDCDEIARIYYHRDDKAANILAPVETQCDWLRDIGFTDVDCYFKVFELAVFGGRREV